jgi:hypothetical protein
MVSVENTMDYTGLGAVGVTNGLEREDVPSLW